MKKKALAIILILAMSMGLIACGSSDDSEAKDASDVTTEAADDTSPGDEETENADEETQVVIPDTDSEEAEEDADLGLEIKKSFNMSGTIKKISYDDILTQGETLEEMLSTALEKSDIGNFVIAFNDYEDDDDDEIDKLAYACAIEDDDTEKAIIEVGAYHNVADNKYYQYNAYTSEDLDSSTDSVKSILAKVESAYGVKLSRKKVQAALKTAWEMAESRGDYYELVEDGEYKGDGYTDMINVRVTVGYDDDDNMSGYIYVERERLYK